jgi:hypothetical protein
LCNLTYELSEVMTGAVTGISVVIQPLAISCLSPRPARLALVHAGQWPGCLQKNLLMYYEQQGQTMTLTIITLPAGSHLWPSSPKTRLSSSSPFPRPVRLLW